MKDLWDVYKRQVFYFGKHTFGNIQFFKYMPVPFKGIYIKAHGPWSVGAVGYVDFAVGQFPYEPGVNGTEKPVSYTHLRLL